MKRLIVLLALAAPAAARPQGFALRPLDVGESLREAGRIAASRPLEQNFILPERPGQNHVAWYRFDWHHVDIPSPSGGRGGVRLYYYDRTREVAERAVPAIRSAYLRLVDQFHYTPTKQIPYILYSSKREFHTTNMFQTSESLLGVTSTRDLTMALPYFGDHERFRETSTHEMVHQFTIQKLLDIAGTDDLPLIDSLPLWFIEGIAEYYSRGGLDPEADLFVRDLVWNPDPERRYEMLAFADDRRRGYIGTYKLGQARVAFIADTWGKERIQAFLEHAYRGGGGYGGRGDGERSFKALVQRVLNEPLEQVESRWRTWLKRRYYPEYMEVRQDLSQMRDYADFPAEPEAYVASPDGWLVLFRGIDREEGRVRLYLADVRRPRGAVEVASDNEPGVESLHPIDANVLALAADKLAFAAQDGAGDSLYVIPFRHDAPQEGRPPRLSVGRRRKVEVRHPEGLRFIEVTDPAFSPDGSKIAFVGLTDLGQRDVYVVPVGGGTARQLTSDPYAERDLAWGRDGIFLASDATDHGLPNLFRIDEATGDRTRLTTAARADRYPRPQADGSVIFSSAANGKPDLFLLRSGQVRRITDFATGLHAPSPAPNGRAFFASTLYRGRFHLVEVPKVAWLDEPPEPVAPPAGPVLEIPREPIPAAAPGYEPLSWRNWHPDGGFIYGGGGSGGVAGRAAVLFSDMMRDRSLFLDLSVYGSFEFTQGLVLYLDRGNRYAWAAGAYHFVNQQLAREDPNVTFLQREFGGVWDVQLPFDRFRRVEVELKLGGVQRFCLTDFALVGTIACEGVTRGGFDVAAWKKQAAGTHPEVSPALRLAYDTVRLDPYTGPLAGSSLLLEVGGAWLPTQSAVNGFARLEAAHWIPIVGRSNLMFRVAAGTSFAPDTRGLDWARTWWLTSADNLRGYSPFDVGYLVGLHYYVANAELQVPFDALFRFFIFDYVEGVAALDFGGVFNRWESALAASGFRPAPRRPLDIGAFPQPGAWEARTLTGVLGVNALLGPLLLRVHFGHPYDIGGQVTPALAARTRWVTNFTIRWAFF